MNLGTAVAILDLVFIFFVVPESLPERFKSDEKVSWSKIDPFAVNILFIENIYSKILLGITKYHSRSFHLSYLFNCSSVVSSR